MKKLILGLIIVAATGQTYASDENNTLGCNEFENFLSSEVGSKCITRLGGVFEKTEAGIKELTSGIEVFTEVKNDVDQYQAIEFCNKQSLTLPSREDIDILEKAGWRIILMNTSDDQFLSRAKMWWTSTVNTERTLVGSNGFETPYAFYLEAVSGREFEGLRRNKMVADTALCIRKQ